MIRCEIDKGFVWFSEWAAKQFNYNFSFQSLKFRSCEEVYGKVLPKGEKEQQHIFDTHKYTHMYIYTESEFCRSFSYSASELEIN